MESKRANQKRSGLEEVIASFGRILAELERLRKENDAYALCQGQLYRTERDKKLEELERLRKNALPELPDGWFYEDFKSNKHHGFYVCLGNYPLLPHKPRGSYSIYDVINNHVSVEGDGPTPRAAVLAAIAKINESSQDNLLPKPKEA